MAALDQCQGADADDDAAEHGEDEPEGDKRQRDGCGHLIEWWEMMSRIRESDPRATRRQIAPVAGNLPIRETKTPVTAR